MRFGFMYCKRQSSRRWLTERAENEHQDHVDRRNSFYRMNGDLCFTPISLPPPQGRGLAKKSLDQVAITSVRNKKNLWNVELATRTRYVGY